MDGYDYLADSWSLGVVVFVMWGSTVFCLLISFIDARFRLTNEFPTDGRLTADPKIKWSLLNEAGVTLDGAFLVVVSVLNLRAYGCSEGFY